MGPLQAGERLAEGLFKMAKPAGQITGQLAKMGAKVALGGVALGGLGAIKGGELVAKDAAIPLGRGLGATALDTAQIAAGATYSGARKAGGFLMDHPRAVIGGAVGAALYASHPLKRSGFGSAFQDVTLGDPNALPFMAKGALQHAIEETVNPTEKALSAQLENQYLGAPYNPYSGPNGGPSGDIVFGMYNLRK